MFFNGKSTGAINNSYCKLPIAVAMSLFLAGTVAAQNFEKLSAKIDSIEQRLSMIIKAESAARQKSDSAISAAINGMVTNAATVSYEKTATSTHAIKPTNKQCTFKDPADAGKSDSCTVEEKEAMAIGGLVTVDASSDPTDINAAAAQVGQVALSANVNVAEGVTASITVLAEGNMSALSIDQAVVEVAPEGKPFVFLFGQQAFNFGLLSTRLISDPSILDAVSTSGPGLAASVSHGAFTPGLGISYFHGDEEKTTLYKINFADSTVAAADSVTEPASDLFTGIVNCDIALPNESTVRMAARFSGDIVDISLGAGFVLGPVMLDAEIYSEAADDDDAKKGGYYAGAAWTINDRMETAFRYDGFSEDSFDDIVHRLGIGATLSFKHGIFCAFEYSVDDVGSDEPQQLVALQVGLESTIKLPGFQRKTLTRK